MLSVSGEYKEKATSPIVPSEGQPGKGLVSLVDVATKKKKKTKPQ